MSACASARVCQCMCVRMYTCVNVTMCVRDSVCVRAPFARACVRVCAHVYVDRWDVAGQCVCVCVCARAACV